MAGRRTKAPAVDDELGELFDGIDKSKTKKPPVKGKPVSSVASKKKAADQTFLADLDDLENDLSAQPPPRPHTPKLKEAATKSSPATAASKRISGVAAASHTPSQSAKHDPRKSTDSVRSYHVAMTPSGTSSEATEPTDQSAAAGPGGWWGGIFATATATAAAAVKQAEGVVTNIQQSEEAKRWTEQVKGNLNVGALRDLGDELRHRAMPTFTNILHTLAPPISQHERLRIHITHDLVGYPSLDPLIYDVFSRVMSQVEGGDLIVIQRGQESTARRPSDGAGRLASQAGWRDGPWWRSSDVPRDMGVVNGLHDGTKLCRVSAESYSMEYHASSGGVEGAKKLAAEPLSESNPVRSSDLFLAVQAIGLEEDDEEDLFASSAKTRAEEDASPAGQEVAPDPMVCFAVYVLDPVHEIAFGTVSQCVPDKWIQWLDARSPLTPSSEDDDEDDDDDDDDDDEDDEDDEDEDEKRVEPARSGVPDEIRDIIESGGVDPREWVSEWVEEALDLSIGVVAQRYVARRMGVGEGGIGKGKQRAEAIIEEGGGEAARAGLI